MNREKLSQRWQKTFDTGHFYVTVYDFRHMINFMNDVIKKKKNENSPKEEIAECIKAKKFTQKLLNLRLKGKI